MFLGAQEWPLRYFLLREIVFGQDGSFSFDALVQRYNADLANDYGNAVSRTLQMITRYYRGEIPYPSANLSEAAEDAIIQALDRDAVAAVLGAIRRVPVLEGAGDGLDSGRSGKPLSGRERTVVTL